LVHLFPVLVSCTEKNLATLIWTNCILNPNSCHLDSLPTRFYPVQNTFNSRLNSVCYSQSRILSHRPINFEHISSASEFLCKKFALREVVTWVL
jgi:hypothetical protein